MSGDSVLLKCFPGDHSSVLESSSLDSSRLKRVGSELR